MCDWVILRSIQCLIKLFNLIKVHTTFIILIFINELIQLFLTPFDSLFFFNLVFGFPPENPIILSLFQPGNENVDGPGVLRVHNMVIKCLNRYNNFEFYQWNWVDYEVHCKSWGNHQSIVRKVLHNITDECRLRILKNINWSSMMLRHNYKTVQIFPRTIVFIIKLIKFSFQTLSFKSQSDIINLFYPALCGMYLFKPKLKFIRNGFLTDIYSILQFNYFFNISWVWRNLESIILMLF